MIIVLLVQGGWVKCVEQYLVNVRNVENGIELELVRGVKMCYEPMLTETQNIIMIVCFTLLVVSFVVYKTFKPIKYEAKHLCDKFYAEIYQLNRRNKK